VAEGEGGSAARQLRCYRAQLARQFLSRCSASPLGQYWKILLSCSQCTLYHCSAVQVRQCKTEAGKRSDRLDREDEGREGLALLLAEDPAGGHRPPSAGWPAAAGGDGDGRGGVAVGPCWLDYCI
jgi:hypothetical protein